MPDGAKSQRPTVPHGYQASDFGSSSQQRTAAGSAETSESNSSQPCRLVRPTDRRLAELVGQSAATINWDVLRISVASWTKRVCVDNRDFAVYTKRSRSIQFVAAIGTVCCSTAELRAILRPNDTDTYAATMTELYGQEFIYGSIVHRSQSDSNEPYIAEVPGHDRRRQFKVSDVAVKTATFEKQHPFSRSETWCYADGVHPLAEGKGFAIVMTSIASDDVFAGKTKATVHELDGIHAAYSVTPTEDAKLVRVGFYAYFKSSRVAGSGGNSHYASKNNASMRAVASRLNRLAEATSRLSMIVRRRRLGAQVYANHNSFRPSNVRCVCCTAKFTLLNKRKKCHLCGYYVCEKCSTKQQMERASRRVFTVRLCEHCMERVDDAQYDNLPPAGLAVPTIQPRAPDTDSSSVVLSRLLRNTLVTAPTAKKPAVKNVIMNLIEQEGSEDTRTLSRQRSLTLESSDAEYLTVLDTRLRVHEFSVDKCALANARSRAYPLAYDKRDTVPMYPLPVNENYRLSVIGRQRMAEVRNLPELELICTLVCNEIKCQIGFITIVGKDATFIIASNSADFRNAVIPREQSLCSYTIMSDKPLLVPYPEADIRFSRLNVVSKVGLRFYFAFPLFAPDKKTVVGAVCCGNSTSLAVDQSQYATMAKLSESVTRIMAIRLKDDDSWANLDEEVPAVEDGDA